MSLELSYIKFKKASGVDLAEFFNKYIDFTENGGYQSIYNYYSGGGRLPQTAFTILDLLIEESIFLQSQFKLHKNIFTNIAAWDLLEGLDNSLTRLLTIQNLKKYLRSSIINVSYNLGVQQTDYILKQRQNFESVSSEILKSQNSDNEWVDIAVDNNVIEEDYTAVGGNVLGLTYNQVGTVNNINVVVDELIGERINGLDIQKELEFESDDLKVLDYDETILQAIDILLGLKKRDNPEFPDHGVKKMVGTSFSAIGYPLIFRQLVNVFSTDDTISQFTIKDIRVESDSVFMDLSIETAYGSVLDKSITF